MEKIGKKGWKRKEKNLTPPSASRDGNSVRN